MLFANMPKQVLWDILDMVDACNESDQLFDELKIVLLGQFGKSKWHLIFSCFAPCLKPSILMDKLKQSLPHGISHGNDLFLAMFLIRPASHARSGRFREPKDSCGDGES
jgi:hypothetical protein